LQLISKDGFAFKKQATNQAAFAIVHTPTSNESQGIH
jgi:hypothetical protein